MSEVISSLVFKGPVDPRTRGLEAMVADKGSVNFLVSEVLVTYVLVGSHKV